MFEELEASIVRNLVEIEQQSTTITNTLFQNMDMYMVFIL